MSGLSSYPQIFNLGHPAIVDLFMVDTYIEEKVDGSQFSFGAYEVTDPDTAIVTGTVLRVRSKSAEMHTDAPEKMFTKAVDTAKALFDAGKLRLNWTYRGEYLQKPKHNTLIYDRAPIGNVVLFDVMTGSGDMLTAGEKAREAERLGLESVPVLADLPASLSSDAKLKLMREVIDHTKSMLGGVLIEGVVVKQVGPKFIYGVDKKILYGKFVSERFKEAHKIAWKESNPSGLDIIDRICKAYGTPARWQKAIQHLRDAGQLQNAPQDIGKLLIEIRKDVGQDSKDEIQKILWKWAWDKIARGLTAGFPEFYKEELLRQQFASDYETGRDLGDESSPVVSEPASTGL